MTWRWTGLDRTSIKTTSGRGTFFLILQRTWCLQMPQALVSRQTMSAVSFSHNNLKTLTAGVARIISSRVSGDLLAHRLLPQQLLRCKCSMWQLSKQQLTWKTRIRWFLALLRSLLQRQLPSTFLGSQPRRRRPLCRWKFSRWTYQPWIFSP